MASLDQYKKNIYSQNGEDGVLAEILRRLDIRRGAFVEFGAWDGKHFSNTYHLLECGGGGGWRGVYIEGDKHKYQRLVRNMKPFAGRVELLNAYVRPTGDNVLDNLLAKTAISQNFEVLSIDIDSSDWQVWESLKNYHPVIVIIEINSSIPVGIYQTHRGGKTRRSSFTSTVELGRKKGYAPVCHTGNLILVKNEVLPKLALPECEILFPETLFDHRWQHLSYESIFEQRPGLLRPWRIFKRIKDYIA